MHSVVSSTNTSKLEIQLVGCNCNIKKDEKNCSGRSQMLQRIATQLQLNKPAGLSEQIIDGDDDQRIIIGSNNNMRNMESVPKRSHEHRRAAVLICIFEGHEGELRVILTKRSMNLSSHPGAGDVALPGGKMDEGDADDSATALREAMEEIGLDPHLVQVVSHLEPFCSKNKLNVVPVIGLLANIEDFKPILNPDEVDAIFDVPLEMFLKGDNHRVEEREWMGYKYIQHHFDFETSKSKQQGGFPICGLTASILIRAASVIYQRPPRLIYQHHHQLPDFQQLQHSFE